MQWRVHGGGRCWLGRDGHRAMAAEGECDDFVRTLSSGRGTVIVA